MIKPLNTYHTTNTDDSSTDGKGTTANGYTPAQYRQQQTRAGARPSQQLPHQLGSLEGIRGSSQQYAGEGVQGAGPRDPLGYSGTLRAPAGQAQGSRSRRKTDKEDSWVDDERFNWD